ncbi:uncharacterized protein BJ171DRAFT_277628 [Polychytrium aggregatum]|uniref:uncharacterized protein n=1 Tax=Polychytrium aggregatum TaxID=110093 RepID=UPI0022FF07B5|nr:uncharacterized protein BJ171DRAFT_277628 [Polychytrium aggregatum]KAI9207564.1 hypothetical protein BJ171DRAFT_277628 [Polychytrium aggregatum]
MKERQRSEATLNEADSHRVFSSAVFDDISRISASEDVSFDDPGPLHLFRTANAVDGDAPPVDGLDVDMLGDLNDSPAKDDIQASDSAKRAILDDSIFLDGPDDEPSFLTKPRAVLPPSTPQKQSDVLSGPMMPPSLHGIASVPAHMLSPCSLFRSRSADVGTLEGTDRKQGPYFWTPKRNPAGELVFDSDPDTPKAVDVMITPKGSRIAKTLVMLSPTGTTHYQRAPSEPAEALTIESVKVYPLPAALVNPSQARSAPANPLPVVPFQASPPVASPRPPNIPLPNPVSASPRAVNSPGIRATHLDSALLASVPKDPAPAAQMPPESPLAPAFAPSPAPVAPASVVTPVRTPGSDTVCGGSETVVVLPTKSVSSPPTKIKLPFAHSHISHFSGRPVSEQSLEIRNVENKNATFSLHWVGPTYFEPAGSSKRHTLPQAIFALSMDPDVAHSVASDSSCALSISFNPVHAGSYKAKLQIKCATKAITIDLEAAVTQEAKKKMTGTRPTPALRISPTPTSASSGTFESPTSPSGPSSRNASMTSIPRTPRTSSSTSLRSSTAGGAPSAERKPKGGPTFEVLHPQGKRMLEDGQSLRINFGQLQANKTATQCLQINNLSSVRVPLEIVVAPPLRVQSKRIAIEPNGSSIVFVCFEPTAEGSFSDQILIRKGKEVIRVQVEGKVVYKKSKQ